MARYQQAADFQSAGETQAGYEITDLLLYVLVGLLILEQLLAWSASYHRSGRPAFSPSARHRMIALVPPLLAVAVARVHFEWGRVPADPALVVPFWAGVAVLFLILALIVWSVYRRDWLELPRAVGILLALIRTLVFVGLIVLFLQPQWRTEQEEVRNSRVLMLADTSSSMGLSMPTRQPHTAVTRPAERAASKPWRRPLGRPTSSNSFAKRTRSSCSHFDRQTNRIVALDKLPVATERRSRT